MSLKVFDLECAQGHVFEGWFQAQAAFEQQRDAGQLRCPVCGDARIMRKLSAPKVASSTLREATSDARQTLSDRQARALQYLRERVRAAEDVGDNFAREALRMHHGETDARAIRGTASPQEQRALAQEGVAVMAVPEFLVDKSLH